MKKRIARLITLLGRERVKTDEPMRNHTTFGIGGPADLFFEARTSDEFRQAVTVCRENNLPYFTLGMGANLLVGDGGIRGLVIRSVDNKLETAGSTKGKEKRKKEADHYRPFETGRYLRFDDLDFTEPEPDTLVRVGAGASLPVLINWTLDKGLTGLQNFAGIPASVGGAVYNNVHGGTKLFDQFIDHAVLLGRNGETYAVRRTEMDFRYDYSRLQRTGEVVLEVVLNLSHGDVGKAKWVREEWLKRKLRVQPQKNCPGCIFKNLSLEEAERVGSPTVSIGWVLDIGLKLKGFRVGGVSVSESHANFFINDGTGTAADVSEIIKICKEKAKDKFNLDLDEEIQMVGEF